MESQWALVNVDTHGIHGLIRGINSVGRSPVPEVNITIFSLATSRRHAIVTVNADNSVSVFDLGSSNGTFLNFKLIPPRAQTRMRVNDIVGFGLATPQSATAHDQIPVYTLRLKATIRSRNIYGSDSTPTDAQSESGVHIRIGSPSSDINSSLIGSNDDVAMLPDVDNVRSVNDSPSNDSGSRGPSSSSSRPIQSSNNNNAIESTSEDSSAGSQKSLTSSSTGKDLPLYSACIKNVRKKYGMSDKKAVPESPKSIESSDNSLITNVDSTTSSDNALGIDTSSLKTDETRTEPRINNEIKIISNIRIDETRASTDSPVKSEEDPQNTSVDSSTSSDNALIIDTSFLKTEKSHTGLHTDNNLNILSNHRISTDAVVKLENDTADIPIIALNNNTVDLTTCEDYPTKEEPSAALETFQIPSKSCIGNRRLCVNSETIDLTASEATFPMPMKDELSAKAVFPRPIVDEHSDKTIFPKPFKDNQKFPMETLIDLTETDPSRNKRLNGNLDIENSSSNTKSKTIDKVKEECVEAQKVTYSTVDDIIVIEDEDDEDFILSQSVYRHDDATVPIPRISESHFSQIKHELDDMDAMSQIPVYDLAADEEYVNESLDWLFNTSPLPSPHKSERDKTVNSASSTTTSKPSDSVASNQSGEIDSPKRTTSLDSSEPKELVLVKRTSLKRATSAPDEYIDNVKDTLQSPINETDVRNKNDKSDKHGKTEASKERSVNKEPINVRNQSVQVRCHKMDEEFPSISRKSTLTADSVNIPHDSANKDTSYDTDEDICPYPSRKSTSTKAIIDTDESDEEQVSKPSRTRISSKETVDIDSIIKKYSCSITNSTDSEDSSVKNCDRKLNTSDSNDNSISCLAALKRKRRFSLLYFSDDEDDTNCDDIGTRVTNSTNICNERSTTDSNETANTSKVHNMRTKSTESNKLNDQHVEYQRSKITKQSDIDSSPIGRRTRSTARKRDAKSKTTCDKTENLERSSIPSRVTEAVDARSSPTIEHTRVSFSSTSNDCYTNMELPSTSSDWKQTATSKRKDSCEIDKIEPTKKLCKELKSGSNFVESRMDKKGIELEMAKRRKRSKRRKSTPCEIDKVDKDIIQRNRRERLKSLCSKQNGVAEETPESSNKVPDDKDADKKLTAKVKVSSGRGGFLLNNNNSKSYYVKPPIIDAPRMPVRKRGNINTEIVNSPSALIIPPIDIATVNPLLSKPSFKDNLISKPLKNNTLQVCPVQRLPHPSTNPLTHPSTSSLPHPSTNHSTHRALPSTSTGSTAVTQYHLPFSTYTAAALRNSRPLPLPSTMIMNRAVLQENVTRPYGGPGPVQDGDARKPPGSSTTLHHYSHVVPQPANHKHYLHHRDQTDVVLNMVRWQVRWFSAYQPKAAMATTPAISGTNPLMPQQQRYVSYDRYRDVVCPLMTLELWMSVYEDWHKNRANRHYFKLTIDKIDPDPRGSHTNIKCRTYVSRREWDKNHFKERTLIVAMFQLALKNNKRSYKETIAFIQHLDRKPIRHNGDWQQYHNSNDTEFRPEFALNMVLVINNIAEIIDVTKPVKCEFLSYVSNAIRLFDAVEYLQCSPLKKILLHPTMDEYNKQNEIDYSAPIFREASLNGSQRRAILEAAHACQSDGPAVYLIDGPPGTGKSTVIIQILMQVLGLGQKFRDREGNSRNKRVLLVAPSNGAIDHLIMKLIEIKRSLGRSFPIKVVRIGSINHIHSDVRSWSVDEYSKKSLTHKLCLDNAVLNQEHIMLIKDLERYKLQRGPLINPELESKINLIKSRLNNFAQLHLKHEYNKRLRLEMLYSINNSHVVCSTLGSCFRLSKDGDLPLEHNISCCIVDEATQCVEQDTLIPLMLGVDKLILVGDPQQLPAVTSSTLARSKGYGESLFARIKSCLTEEHLTNPANHHSAGPIRFLDTQYRMHPHIAHFPNMAFYKGRLHNDRTVNNPVQPQMDSFEMNYYLTQQTPPSNAIMSPTEGSALKRRCPRSLHNLKPYLVIRHMERDMYPSQEYHNQSEVDLVITLLRHIVANVEVYREGVEQTTVGVITPYSRQRDMIVESMRRLNIHKDKVDVSVNTVDGIQGQEKDVIIISNVRLHRNSFIDNENRMNVALTRARHVLYIVGSENLFKESEIFRMIQNDAIIRNLHVSVSSPSEISNCIFSN